MSLLALDVIVYQVSTKTSSCPIMKILIARLMYLGNHPIGESYFIGDSVKADQFKKLFCIFK
jgi:hypothetical protein